MAHAAPTTFEQRLARIESQVAGKAGAEKKENLVQTAPKNRRVHLDMLVVGAMGGGLAGTLFALNVGLLVVVSLDATTLYQMLISDYVTAAIIAGVAIAPTGFVLSQIFARSNPRGWQFWIGYLAGVLGANYTDITAFYYILTNPVV